MYKWKVIPTSVVETHYDPDDEKSYMPYKIMVECKSDNPHYQGCKVQYYRNGKGSPDYQKMRELKRENAYLKRKIADYEFFGTLKEIDLKKAEYQAEIKHQNERWKYDRDLKIKCEEVDRLKARLYDLENKEQE